MLQLIVPDLSCGHCMNVIGKAVAKVDSNAAVSFDLDTQTVSVASSKEDAEITAAIEDAGYPVSFAEPEPASSCCGTCKV
jgi:copper chaperone